MCHGISLEPCCLWRRDQWQPHLSNACAQTNDIMIMTFTVHEWHNQRYWHTGCLLVWKTGEPLLNIVPKWWNTEFQVVAEYFSRLRRGWSTQWIMHMHNSTHLPPSKECLCATILISLISLEKSCCGQQSGTITSAEFRQSHWSIPPCSVNHLLFLFRFTGGGRNSPWTGHLSIIRHTNCLLKHSYLGAIESLYTI